MDGQIQTPFSWKGGDRLTAAKLNSFLADATIKSGSITLEMLSEGLSNIINQIIEGKYYTLFKVGDYFPSDNDDLTERFGGTWVRAAIGEFLLGSDGTSDDAKYKVGSSGGESEVTLTAEQIPSHTHPITTQIVRDYFGGGEHLESSGGGLRRSRDVVTDAAGGGKAHNNMPPYTATNWWKKVSNLLPEDFQREDPDAYKKYFGAA